MKTMIVIGLPLFLTGCASLVPSPAPTPFPTSRPVDFQFKYYWETGSLPPPYFFAYEIFVGPGAKGEIKFQADYSGDNTPIWIETIDITENDLDQLYEMLYAMGMFEKEWLQVTDTPTGGGASYLAGIAYEQAFNIPSYVAGEQQAQDAKALYEHIDSLVPKGTWDKLMALHDAYVAENEDA